MKISSVTTWRLFRVAAVQLSRTGASPTPISPPADSKLRIITSRPPS